MTRRAAAEVISALKVIWYIVIHLHTETDKTSDCDTIKGIGHPKMEILSSYTHPHVVPNLYDFFYSAEYTRRYVLDILHVLDPIDFHCMDTRKTKTFFETSFFLCSTEERKVWNNMRVSKWWKNKPHWFPHIKKASLSFQSPYLMCSMHVWSMFIYE